MGDKSKRIRLVLALCASLIVNCISLLGIAPSPISSIAQAVEISELTLPLGEIEEFEAYEVIDKNEIEKVPCYDNGISTYNDTSDIFKQGTGNYGYNCLLADQKKFYDSLETSLNNFNNDDNSTFTKITYPSGRFDYTPFKVNFSDIGITNAQVLQTWYFFLKDHPWLFWLSMSATGSNVDFVPLVKKEYENIVVKKALDAIIRNEVQEYINTVEETKDVYEKVRIIHDKIIDKVNYAYKADGSTPETEDWAHNIIGVLDNSHYAVVCEGYAKTFSFILNILDIPNVYIEGNAISRDSVGPHAWNAVSFDNGSTYYYVDVTWNDMGGKNIADIVENTYIYFAMPKDKFETNHIPYPTTGSNSLLYYEMPNLGNDMDKTYFKKYLAYATDDMVDDIALATEFLKSAKELAPNETCLMLLEDNAVKSISAATKALGGSSYLCVINVKEYNMKLFIIPSDKNPLPTPSTSPVVASDTYIFTDYNYNNPVTGSAVVIYGNGISKTINGKKVNNKTFTAYTDILASYKYILNSKGIVKPSIGKVIVGVTKSNVKPEVSSKNKITDTSASNIAKAKIKNGQITVTATGKEGGLIYLWVIDTGNKGISACCPINIKLAPKKLEVQNTTGTKLTKTKLVNGNTLEVCVAGIVGSTKTVDCTYTATVDSKYQNYITVTPVQGSTNKFRINAIGLNNNKDTKAVVTFKCDQNGKKTNFSLTVTKKE